MYASGEGGAFSIAEKLNNDPVYRNCNGKTGWYKTYVEQTLKNRAVLGEWRPGEYVDGKRVPVGDPIRDYYPRIVEDDLFYQVQAIRATAGASPGCGGGRNTSIANLFSHGKLRCARCRGIMAHMSKGRGGQYLKCEKARRGLGCNEHTVRYDKLEPTLLHWTRGLDARKLLVAEGDKTDARRLTIEGVLLTINEEVTNLRRSIGRTKDDDLAKELEAELGEVIASRKELKQELAKIAECGAIRTPEAAIQHLRSIEDLIQRMEQLKGAGRMSELAALRRRLRHALHQLIDRIEIDRDEHRFVVFVVFLNRGAVKLALGKDGAFKMARTKYRPDQVQLSEEVAATLRHRQIDISAYLARPILPPRLQTRTNSAAARSWSGVNITPKVETTTSKLSSENGRASASASRNSMLSRSASARSRARSSRAGT
jgi:hypothetical protein